ncbi:septal ring lytic transglycosylase RlpA family protein [Megalodesulfovibrio gigas]|uniref:Probable endolytic peptidoglycan transglycosylase RlpA n=1 Tax=Megalodesulfovibrio gigas (strain ATCC 19364 / DSM 1382 / NCIMB 9332 / VKM B-1759) TaxID=1121448 RepID=T2G9E7_MEGG1|nr:septal ring lytic transglycosylase RlpA family protein [Megalodesulfovibrio gigas]AGW13210.1 hypothetical protein DGI_1363 [Megalodesulfovibrio gigas DSM 1382 = ATCC 19364]
MLRGIVAACLLVSSVSATALCQEAGLQREGLAAYFAKELHGRRTYSGERCDMWDLTCAHPSLPMDTVVRVTNPVTSQYCDVRVVDRGPFGGARIIDVSYAAAKELGMLADGVCPVVLTPLIDLSPDTLTTYWELFDFAMPSSAQPTAP